MHASTEGESHQNKQKSGTAVVQAMLLSIYLSMYVCIPLDKKEPNHPTTIIHEKGKMGA